MKKSLYLLLAIGLVVSTAFMAGCGKKENPFEPTTDSYNATQAVESQGPTVLSMNTRDGDNSLYEAPTYDEIVILFDADMNASTINTTNILLQDVEHMGTALSYTVTYDNTSKKAVIKINPTTGWDDDLSYLVTVTTGVKDLHGNALDGNGNDWVDPQDYYREQFWGHTSAVATYDIIPPHAAIGNPANNGIYFSLSDSIIVTITDNDSVDRASITDSAFVLTNAAGQVVALPAMYVEEAFAPTTYIVRFRPLSTVLKESTDYFFTVKTSIKDKRGNRLDGDGDNKSENEFVDRKRIKFRTYDPRNGGTPNLLTNLRVFSASYVDNNRALAIRFTHKMNPTTLTSANIKIYNNSGYTGYVPGTISLLPDSMGIRYSLENFDGSGYLWISRHVKDTAGVYLDENNNGIPGEAPYTTGPGAYQAGDDMYGAITYTSGLYLILFDDMVENGNVGWSTRGTLPQLWHRSPRRVSSNVTNNGGQYSWHCGVDADSSYLVAGPVAVHDTLMMPEMDLTAYNIYTNAYFGYSRWIRTDGGADYASLLASTDGGTTWTPQITWSSGAGAWSTTGVYVTAYLGTKVRFALAFDTDASGNTSEGVYFDNIRLLVW